MESDQVAQRLTWQDEQQRKISQALARLTDRVGAAETALAKQERRGQEMSADVTRLNAVAAKLQQFEDALHKHRQEVARLLEAAEERRSAKEKSLQQIHKAELEETGRAIAEIRLDLGLLGQVQQSLEARREEELRIGRALDGMQKQLETLRARDEDRAGALASLEEDRRQEARRAADAQAELSVLKSRMETAQGLLDGLTDQARKAETRLADLWASEGERQESLGVWLEQQNLRQAEAERAWKEWERRFAAFEKRAGEIDERILAYEETYRGLRQLREELSQLMERLERRIHEITEMQRLAEDRLRHEWTSFQAEDAKRWNAHKLTLDEQWREHGRAHERIASTTGSHQDRLDTAEGTLGDLVASNDARLTELIALLRSWSAEQERKPSETRRAR